MAASVDISFPMLPSRAINNCYINWMFFTYIVYLTRGFKTIQVTFICEFVFCTLLIQRLIRRQSDSMVNRMRIHSAQSIFIWKINRREAISTVAKLHHVIGRGLMIQQVILIFIKCLSANQNKSILHESVTCFESFGYSKLANITNFWYLMSEKHWNNSYMCLKHYLSDPRPSAHVILGCNYFTSRIQISLDLQYNVCNAYIFEIYTLIKLLYHINSTMYM